MSFRNNGNLPSLHDELSAPEFSGFFDPFACPQLSAIAVSSPFRVVNQSGETFYTPVTAWPHGNTFAQIEAHPGPSTSDLTWFSPQLELNMNEAAALPIMSDVPASQRQYRAIAARPTHVAVEAQMLQGLDSQSHFGHNLRLVEYVPPSQTSGVALRTTPTSSRRAPKKTPPHDPEHAHKKVKKIINWEQWKGNLKTLYITEQHTWKEMPIELELVHNFKVAGRTLVNQFQKWEDFAKNTGRQMSRSRKRQAQSLDRKDSPMAHLFNLKEHPYFQNLNSHADPKSFPSVEAEPYVNQYKMLHYIDMLAKEIAGDPDRAAVHNPAWELALERCQGFVSVCKVRAGPSAEFLFKRLRNELAESMRPADPMFLVHIWQICRLLSSFHFPNRNNASRFIFLIVFLRGIGRHVSRNDSLLSTLDALLRILNTTPEALKWTLSIGCWKSKDMFEQFAIQAVTDKDSLRAGAFCVQNWRSSFEVNFEKLQDLYKPQIDRLCEPYPLTEEQVNILYCYTSALVRIAPLELKDTEKFPILLKATPIILKSMAALLHHASRSCCEAANAGCLRFDAFARAFSFSTELVAKCLLEERNRKKRSREQNDSTHWQVLRDELGPSHTGRTYDMYMDDAINILRRGDADCQIRAAELSRRLSRWLKSYNLGPKTESRDQNLTGVKTNDKQPRGRKRTPGFRQEKQRTAEIMAGICPTPDEIRVKKIQERQRVEQGDKWHKRWHRELRDSQRSVLAPLAHEAQIAEDAVGLVVPEARRTCKACDVVFAERRGMFIHLEGSQKCRETLQNRRRASKKKKQQKSCPRLDGREGPATLEQRQQNPWKEVVEIGPTIDPRVLLGPF